MFNVPRFVEKWGRIEELAEQEGESLHAVVKAELRSLACVRNKAEKMRLVLERTELRSAADKSLIQPTPRLKWESGLSCEVEMILFGIAKSVSLRIFKTSINVYSFRHHKLCFFLYLYYL